MPDELGFIPQNPNNSKISPTEKFFHNLAKDLSRNDLERIAGELRDGFDRDRSSMLPYLERMEQYNNLFSMNSEVKEFPWRGAANVKTPTINMVVNNHNSRLFLNLLDRPKIVKANTKILSDSEQMKALNRRAQRVEDLYNYTFNFDQLDFMSQMMKTGHNMFLHGLGIQKTFFDEFTKKIVSRNVNPSDIIYDYYTVDFSTSYRYCQIHRLNENEIKILGEQGIYINTEELSVQGNSEAVRNFREQKLQVGQKKAGDDYTSEGDVLEFYTYIKLNKNDVFRRPLVVTMHKESQTILRITSMEDPNNKNGEPINPFTFYKFLTNPVSPTGYGFGQLLLHITEAMSSTTNQILDAATLSNTTTGFINNRTFMDKDDIQMEMGKFTGISSDDLRKDLMKMDFNPPSGVNFSLLQYLQTQVDRQTTTTELQQGILKSETSATQAALADENGNTQLESTQTQFLNSFRMQLKTYQKLFPLFIDKKEYVDITVPRGNGQLVTKRVESSLLKEDFAEDFKIEPTADPRITSQQKKIVKAQALQNLVATNPILAQNPQIQSFVTENFLEAIRADETTKAAFRGAFGEIEQGQQEQLNLVEQQNQLEGQINQAQNAPVQEVQPQGITF